MNALTATSVHAAHAYRAWTQPISPYDAPEIPQDTVTNRRVEAVKIELSAAARNHLARPGSTSPASGEKSSPDPDTHVNTLSPDGAGRREAPLRTTSNAPAYRPPGGMLDLRV